MAMANGTDAGTPLFDEQLLKGLDFSKTSVKLKNGLCPNFAGDNLQLRPLNSTDFSKGYLTLLSQLTSVGEVDHDQYLERFHAMKNCKDSYFVVVVEDESDGKVVASGTLAIEQKFIHGATKKGRIEDIVVDENYRSKKLGKLLVETLTLLSADVGCYKTSLECLDSLVGFYSLFGFKKEDQQNYLCKRFFS